MKKIILIVALVFASGIDAQAQTRVLVAAPARRVVVVTRRPVVVAPVRRVVVRPAVVARPVAARRVVIVRH
ncbi:hypothetical protein [Mucilaginibacter paludis]|uniref:Uncharacterized protein n=1 Tax=Mucilaginibacter paludis DSM 18603 TaxID=714943 RepID=H1YCW6_9SPHI|nr:hypothetical protein [Mucilaginibacter paludis]EHQ25137.1 hypothetical protein Mucpa_0962 [Mucilaginibacter paludis DSM 18603]